MHISYSILWFGGGARDLTIDFPTRHYSRNRLSVKKRNPLNDSYKDERKSFKSFEII